MPLPEDPLARGLRRYLSPDTLERLAAARVGIAGAGGLGSNVAVHLVRSGIRRLVLADGDTVASSNLNRQCFYPDQLGRPKVEALAETLTRLSPQLELTCHCRMLTAADLESVFADCPIVVEAFDAPAAKTMLIERLLPSGRYLVAASGIGGYGCPDTIRVRRLHPNLDLVGDGVTEAGQHTPPMSPRVGIAAAMQADLVLQHLLGTCTGPQPSEEPCP